MDGPTLATELRRRRAPRSIVDGVEGVDGSAYIAGDLRHADTAILVLAAWSLMPGDVEAGAEG